GNPLFPVDANYKTIEPAGGANLRSDDQWLYFTRDKEVRRLRSDSPPVRLNFAALALEATQVIQDRNDSVRLVEGKPTIVHAYARLIENTTSQSDWFPGAELRGFLDGNPLPGADGASGSPIYPLNRPAITGTWTTTTDYSILRTARNRSFEF